MKSKYKSFIYTIGVLFFATGVLNMSSWMYICTKHTDFEETKKAYLGLFPEFLQNAFLLTAITILLFAIAAFIFYKSKNAGYLKKTSQILMVFSSILCGWNIFSLM
ncbi:hypothetical protein [Flavobacterium foetidum]|uniref:hypothetical protein n=1 Tax=Flavobacterium foetidum TaxID=2026681 RepID=UPI001074E5B5|nr:hypothetical protein [Flavobacterium foetidum]KAF2515224.1 hypothetical protein E0W73_09805 [Flavobacterium foetidum]